MILFQTKKINNFIGEMSYSISIIKEKNRYLKGNSKQVA